jgi:hypothetical protein
MFLRRVEKAQKRASSVMKLTQENEKLMAELKAMTERIEVADRKRQEIVRKREAHRVKVQTPVGETREEWEEIEGVSEESSS